MDKRVREITDQFKGSATRLIGIRPSHAIAAVDSPDQFQAVVVDDIRIGLYLKIVTANSPFAILVSTNEKSDAVEIYDGLRIYPDLTPNALSRTPLEILEALVGRFGLDLRVGDRNGRFFYDELVPFAEGQPVQLLSGAGTHAPEQFVVEARIKVIEEEEQRFVRVALAYGIDYVLYTAWLKSHGWRSP